MRVEIEGVKNIMEVIVKEVEVTRLGINIRLAVGEDGIEIKRS